MIIDHKKNTAFELSLPMVDSATPASFKAGLSPTDTAYYKDGAGAWTALAIADTLAEIGSTGVYEISLTASELNHDWVVIKITAAGAADTFVSFRMHSNEIDDLAAIKAKTDNLPSDPADQSLVIAATNAIVADTSDIQSRLPAALVGGRMDSDLGAKTGNVALSTQEKADVNAEADTALADYDGPTKAEMDSGFAGLETRSGTAQAGGAATITLDAGASATDNYYQDQICQLDGGTGAGQSGIMESYVGATKVGTMSVAWATAPDNTTTFTLRPLGSIAGASAPTAAQVADAVHDEARAGHDAAGSFGEALLNILAATAPKKKVADSSTGQTTVYKEDGTTVRYTEQVQAGATDDEVEVVRV